MCIYIYIKVRLSISLSLSLSIHIYIYIYTNMCVYIYIYVYVHIRSSWRRLQLFTYVFVHTYVRNSFEPILESCWAPEENKKGVRGSQFGIGILFYTGAHTSTTRVWFKKPPGSQPGVTAILKRKLAVFMVLPSSNR